MGYYHVEDTGKGVYIRGFDNINNDYKMPPIDYLQKYIEYQNGGYTDHTKNLDWLSEMDIRHQLAFLSISNYEFSGMIDDLDVHTPKEFCNAYDENFYFEKDAPLMLECLFCYRYGYPFGCFKGISDYDDNIMFYCCVKYPPKEYNKALGELTEDVFLKQLREFLCDLLGDDYYSTVELALCEEYIKE